MLPVPNQFIFKIWDSFCYTHEISRTLSHMSCVLHPVLYWWHCPWDLNLNCVMVYLNPRFGRSFASVFCFVFWFWFCCCCCCFLPRSSKSPVAQSYFLFLSLFFWIGKRPQEKVIGCVVYFSGLASTRFWHIFHAALFLWFLLWRFFLALTGGLIRSAFTIKKTLILSFVFKFRNSYQDLSGSGQNFVFQLKSYVSLKFFKLNYLLQYK